MTDDDNTKDEGTGDAAGGGNQGDGDDQESSLDRPTDVVHDLRESDFTPAPRSDDSYR